MTGDEASSDDSKVISIHAAVARLVDGTASSEDLSQLRKFLIRLLLLSGYNIDDVEDIASDTLVKFLTTRGKSDAEEVRHPTVYLSQLARWVAIDHMRATRRGREVFLAENDFSHVEVSEDDSKRLIDGLASVDVVKVALRQARSKGDSTAFRVAVCFLDIAATAQREPSNREIAEELGLSHVAVGKALTRFRDYVPIEGYG